MANTWYILFFFSNSFLMVDASTRPTADKITSLPSVNFQIRFEQYSGYLDAGAGSYLHYWFIESQTKPQTDPLILFLNGGPGCSSLIALFTEVGPFRIKESGKSIVENPFAWNKVANMLFLESPIGTGFSYGSRPQNLSDERSVNDHYNALLSFYEKFPEFKKRRLFLVGQSYAAVFVSTLAQRILTQAKAFPGIFQGVGMANGVLSLPSIINSRVYYNYYHGLLEEKQLRRVIEECCSGPDQWHCNFYNWYGQPTSKCFTLVKNAIDVASVGRDPYNINFECYLPSTQYSNDEECGVPFGNITKHYFDRQDVRQAIHIDVERFRAYSFEACSTLIPTIYQMQHLDLTDIISGILDTEKIRMIIFTGDWDSVANFLAAQWFVDNLNRTKIGDRQPIYYRGITQPNVGYQENFKGLDFLIIRGAGHYAPADRPRETLQIMTNYLRGQTNYSSPDGVDTTPAPLVSVPGKNSSGVPK